MLVREEDRKLFWFKVGQDMGLVLASCSFVHSPDRYGDIESRLLKLKAEILKGGNEDEEVEDFDVDLKQILADYIDIVDPPYDV
jgi:hypothetical protein